VGEVGRVGSVLEGGALRRRLMELGFVPGTIVRVVRRAPLRDPMEVELHGYHLSLRRSEALAVQIVPVSPAASPASAAP
jgi:Fe2+ transport system protein FeoA